MTERGFTSAAGRGIRAPALPRGRSGVRARPVRRRSGSVDRSRGVGLGPAPVASAAATAWGALGVPSAKSLAPRPHAEEGFLGYRLPPTAFTVSAGGVTSMPKFPETFPFEPANFLTGTSEMTPAEVGIYIRLLCHQWIQGDVPSNLADNRRITGGKKSLCAGILSAKFEPCGEGRARNAKMEEVRELALSTALRRSESAKVAAHARWNEECATDAIRIAEGDAEGVPRTRAGSLSLFPISKEEAGKARSTQEPGTESGNGTGKAKGVSQAAGFREAFEAWKATLPAEARPLVKATKKRREKYDARRAEGYDHQTLLAAVTNYIHDTWEGRLVDARARDFVTLLRDGGQVEKFSQMKPVSRRAPESKIPNLTGRWSEEPS